MKNSRLIIHEIRIVQPACDLIKRDKHGEDRRNTFRIPFTQSVMSRSQEYQAVFGRIDKHKVGKTYSPI